MANSWRLSLTQSTSVTKSSSSGAAVTSTRSSSISTKSIVVWPRSRPARAPAARPPNLLLAETYRWSSPDAYDEKPERVIPKISQETLAEMVGTTRARVNFFMNKFRKMGLIDYNGDLEIHSSLLDVVLYDEPRVTGSSLRE